MLSLAANLGTATLYFTILLSRIAQTFIMYNSFGEGSNPESLLYRQVSNGRVRLNEHRLDDVPYRWAALRRWPYRRVLLVSQVCSLKRISLTYSEWAREFIASDSLCRAYLWNVFPWLHVSKNFILVVCKRCSSLRNAHHSLPYSIAGLKTVWSIIQNRFQWKTPDSRVNVVGPPHRWHSELSLLLCVLLSCHSLRLFRFYCCSLIL